MRLRKIIFASLILTALARGQANYASPYVFEPFAGISSAGAIDGPAAGARFYQPGAVVADPAGNLFVADTRNHTIRKISAEGAATTVAGSPGKPGSADGKGATARFNGPLGLARDSAGNLYVADTLNHIIRKVAPDGTVTTLAGTAGVSGSADGLPGEARFAYPRGIAVDATGNVYVLDPLSLTIRKITPTGTVSTFAGTAGVSGAADGTGMTAQFLSPNNLTIDASGNLYVLDAIVNLRKITPAGVVTTVFFRNYEIGRPGPPPYIPVGIAVTGSGRIFFTDRSQQAIYEIEPANNRITLLAGGSTLSGGSIDGTGSAAEFYSPAGLTADFAGNLFVADTGNNSIRKVTPFGVVTTVAGTGVDAAFGSADGAKTTATFEARLGVAVASNGDLYVADEWNKTIRKITSAGTVSTLAGSKTTSYSAVDGTGADARFSDPSHVAVDPVGNVYVTDGNSIRKITLDGTVTTFAGDASASGSADGIGRAARFTGAAGLAVGAGGALFVADSWNSTIRRITPDGAVTTFAGTAGSTGSIDGIGPAARFNRPQGIAADAAGNLYVADTNNNLVRKITPEGAVTTLAVSPTGDGLAGTGSEAPFTAPESITVDGAGNVYLAQRYGQIIRKITPQGVVTTVAGFLNRPAYVHGLGADARFIEPWGIAADSTGTLFVTDGATVRKGAPAGPPVITRHPQNLSVTAGDTVQFSVNATGIPAPTYQWFYNGSPVAGATQSTFSFTLARLADAGEYNVVATNALGSIASSKAILTVANATGPGNPPPASAASGGSSGGGAISLWALLGLSAICLARQRSIRRATAS